MLAVDEEDATTALLEAVAHNEKSAMSSATGLMVLGAALFGLGVVGFLTRRNLIVMFLCTEVMFQGVLVNLVAMGVVWKNLQGQMFGLYVLVIAAVEAGLGLAIVVMLYRRRGTLDAESWRGLRG
ncbi:MAG: hypothetical protein HBSAPP02_15780 [Phycisphaerae bacterium]|nr:MAG: hypothetical protein HBSAPP02_15780 [Phycisphaerae bacterium]